MNTTREDLALLDEALSLGRRIAVASEPNLWTEAQDASARVAAELERLRTLPDAELIGHAQDARDAVEAPQYGQGLPPAGGWKRHMQDDPDYSPAYQDEYQRLWHQAAADLARAAAERDAYKAALVEIAQADAKTPVLTLNRIAERALTAVENARRPDIDPETGHGRVEAI